MPCDVDDLHEKKENKGNLKFSENTHAKIPCGMKQQRSLQEHAVFFIMAVFPDNQRENKAEQDGAVFAYTGIDVVGVAGENISGYKRGIRRNQQYQDCEYHNAFFVSGEYGFHIAPPPCFPGTVLLRDGISQLTAVLFIAFTNI